MQMKDADSNNTKILQVICGLILLTVVSGANAACMALGPANFPGTMTRDFGDIVVSPTTVAGDIIASVDYTPQDIRSAINFNSTAGSYFLRCGSDDILLFGNSTYGVTSYNGSEYVDTGIKGFAFQVTPYGGLKSLFSSFMFPPEYDFSLNGIGEFNRLSYLYMPTLTVSLKKISDNVNSGVVPAGTLFNLSQRGTSFIILDYNISTFNIIMSACAVSDYPAEVSLGSAYSHKFRRPGDTGNETNFNISLTCNSSSLYPVVTFEGSTDAEHPTVFTNSSGDGFARNVGVQLLRNSSIITPGRAVSLGQAAASLNQYEFRARLFRLNGAVTAGSIDVPVTFTISYE